MQIVERYFGLLEVHSEVASGDSCRRASRFWMIWVCRKSDRLKPRILSSQIVRHVDDHQVQLINRMRHGHMLIPGQTLYVLEVEPAPYAALAANEAEKAAEINILEVRAFGSFGRVYLGGEERDIDVGWRAAVGALEDVQGREIEALKTLTRRRSDMAEALGMIECRGFRRHGGSSRRHGQGGQSGAGEHAEDRWWLCHSGRTR